MLGWELTLYKAKLHAKHGWSTYDKSDRHKAALEKKKTDNAALLLQAGQRHQQTLTSQKQKYDHTVSNLKHKLHESQVANSNLKRSKTIWKAPNQVKFDFIFPLIIHIIEGVVGRNDPTIQLILDLESSFTVGLRVELPFSIRIAYFSYASHHLD